MVAGPDREPEPFRDRGGPTHRDGPMAFVASLEAPELEPHDHHHFAKVLRVAVGEPMVVSDGAGRWRRALFAEHPEPVGEIAEVHAPGRSLAVGFALLKGDKPEWVAQKLTELGIDRIVPFTSDHCAVRWKGERGAREVERLRRVARAAAMQCRRTRLPVVEEATTFAELRHANPSPVIADAEGGGLFDPGDEAPPTFVLIGPEGGWSDDERSAGLRSVRIAEHVLRADTAAVTVGALLAARRDGYC